MAAKFINLTDTLEQWRVKANAVYGTTGDLETLTKNATVDYSNLTGANENDFTGVAAEFSVSRVAGGYEVSIQDGGSGYEVGDTIVIDGTLLGGVTGTNDATITVDSVDPGFAITGVSIAGVASSDIISELNALRTELGSLLDFSLDTDSQTFYEAVNEHESDIGTVEALLTDADNLTDAVGELETALRGANVTYGLDTNTDDVVSAINEIEKILRDGGSGVASYVLNTSANDIVAAINEHESDIGTVQNLSTDATNLTLATNELETAVRGTNATYGLDTTSNNLVSAINEHESDLGKIEDLSPTGASTDHPQTVDYVDLGDDVVEALNSLKSKADFLADEVGGELKLDYDGSDNNIVSALNNLYAASSVSTLNDIYLRRDAQDWVTGTTFRVGPDGIAGGIEETSPGVYSYTDFKLKAYDSNEDLQDRITIKNGSGNVGIGGAPSTTKLKVTGAINATTGFQWNGQSTDARYLTTGGSTAQTVSTATNFTGSLKRNDQETDDRYVRTADGSGQTITTPLTIDGGIGVTSDLTIGSEKVYDEGVYTFTEWNQDLVGNMFTGNAESGGISATYVDATGKITLDIADNSHSHTSVNISDFTEATQDVVGGMISGNSETGISVVYDDSTGKLNFDVDMYKQVAVTDNDSGYSWSTSGTATGGEYNDTLVFVDGDGINIDIDASSDAIRISHTDTSSQGSVNNSNGVVIQDISLDTYGHLTSIGSTDLDNRYSLNAFSTIAVDTTDGDRTWHNSGANVVADNRSDTLYFVESSSIDIDTDDGGDGIRWQVKDEYIQDVVGGMVSSNSESGLSVTYDDGSGKINFNVNDPTITLSGDVTGSATMSNLGSMTINTTVGNNSHTHTPSNITDFNESVQDVVGSMLSGNTESGISVTYDDGANEIDFTVSAGNANIQNGAITNEKIANDAVTGDKIADNNILRNHLANDAVGAAELLNVQSLAIKNSAGRTVKTIYGAGS